MSRPVFDFFFLPSALTFRRFENLSIFGFGIRDEASFGIRNRMMEDRWGTRRVSTLNVDWNRRGSIILNKKCIQKDYQAQK
jgi:hypothetical protein